MSFLPVLLRYRMDLEKSSRVALLSTLVERLTLKSRRYCRYCYSMMLTPTSRMVPKVHLSPKSPGSGIGLVATK